MGRPSKLTAKRQTAICKALKHGASFEAAAAVAGLHQSTFTKWRKRGSRRKAPARITTLCLAIERAQAEGEALAAQAVFKSFTECSIETVEEILPGDAGTKTKTITRPPDPRIALSWLERRCSKRWNPAHRLHLGADPDSAPVVTYLLPSNGRDATPAPDGDASFADAPGRLDPDA